MKNAPDLMRLQEGGEVKLLHCPRPPGGGPVGRAWRGPGSESVQKIALISRRSTVSARAERLIVRTVRSLVSWAKRALLGGAGTKLNASIRVAVMKVFERMPSMILVPLFVCILQKIRRFDRLSLTRNSSIL